MDLPLWLQNNSPLAPSPSKLKQSNFIQKTLQGIITFVRESVYSEEIALRSGFLQTMDPRMKLLAFFSLLITVNLLRHLPLLWVIYLIILILAVLLTLTTRWNNLLRALRTIFVPKIFIVTLEMTYRYIFVLITLLEDMFLARKARDSGHSS